MSQNILSYSTPFYLSPSTVSENLLEKTTLENQLIPIRTIINKDLINIFDSFIKSIEKKDFKGAYILTSHYFKEDDTDNDCFGQSLVALDVFTHMLKEANHEWNNFNYIYLFSVILGEIIPTVPFISDKLQKAIKDKKEEELIIIIRQLEDLTYEIKNKTKNQRTQLSDLLDRKPYKWKKIRSATSDLEKTLASIAEEKSLKAIDALTDTFIKSCNTGRWYAAIEALSAFEEIGPRAHHKIDVFLNKFEEVLQKDPETAYHIVEVIPDLIPDIFKNIHEIKDGIESKYDIKIEEISTEVCKFDFAVSPEVIHIFKELKKEASKNRVNWYKIKTITKKFTNLTYKDIPSLSAVIDKLNKTVNSTKKNKWQIVIGLSTALGYAGPKAKPAIPFICTAILKAKKHKKWDAITSMAYDIENIISWHQEKDITDELISTLTAALIEARKKGKWHTVKAITSVFKKINLKAPQTIHPLIDTLLVAIQKEKREVAEHITSILPKYIPGLFIYINNLKNNINRKNKKDAKISWKELNERRKYVPDTIIPLFDKLQNEANKKRLNWTTLRNVITELEKISYKNIPAMAAIGKTLLQALKSRKKKKWDIITYLSSVFKKARSEAKPAVPLLSYALSKIHEEKGNSWDEVSSIADDIYSICKDDAPFMNFPLNILYDALREKEWDAVEKLSAVISKNITKKISIPVLMRTYAICMNNQQKDTADKIKEYLNEIGFEGQVAVRSLRIEDISKWVKLRAHFTRHNEYRRNEEEFTTDYHEYPRSLAKHILTNGFTKGELRLAIDIDVPEGIFKDRPKFIALALFIALTDPDPKNLHNIKPINEYLPIIRSGLVRKIEKRDTHPPYKIIDKYLEYVLNFTYQPTEDDLTKWFLTMQNLNLGFFISSGVRVFDSSLEKLSYLRLDARHRSIIKLIETKFGREFVRILRKYERLKKPEAMYRLPDETKKQFQQKVKNRKKCALEDILHKRWIGELWEQKHIFNRLVPFLDVIQGMTLQNNLREGDKLTVGNKFVGEVRRLILSISEQIQEIASWNADLSNAPKSIGEYENVFIDEKDPKASARYASLMVTQHAEELETITSESDKLLCIAQ